MPNLWSEPLAASLAAARAAKLAQIKQAISECHTSSHPKAKGASA